MFILICPTFIIKYIDEPAITTNDVIVANTAPEIPRSGISNTFNITFTTTPAPLILRLKFSRPTLGKNEPIDLKTLKITICKINICNGKTT